MMAVSLVCMLSVGTPTKDNLIALGWWFFIHNCFASLQDVATDALAVDILPKNEHGKVNGLMWGSKLFGKGIGAGVSGWILVDYGFAEAVWTQFGLLIAIMMFPLFCVERSGEKRLPWTTGQANLQADVTSVRSLVDVTADLLRGFKLRSTLNFAIFGVFAVIGWGIVEVATKKLYTQDLNWNSKEYSSVAGWAVSVELLGALTGGWMADRFDRRWVMTLGFGLYGTISLVFAACPGMWETEWFSIGFLFLNPGFIAMGAVGYNSMGMRVSWTKASATMFTVYMTLSNVGHVVGNYAYGWLRTDREFSFETTFYVAGIAMLVPLVMLPGIRPTEVDEQIAEEELVASEGEI
jgi:PAT family beta-lactamase induction signal transducer AmpG